MSWYRVDVSCEAFNEKEQLELEDTGSYLIEADTDSEAKLKAIRLSESLESSCNSKMFLWVTKGVMDIYHIGERLENGTVLGSCCKVHRKRSDLGIFPRP